MTFAPLWTCLQIRLFALAWVTLAWAGSTPVRYDSCGYFCQESSAVASALFVFHLSDPRGCILTAITLHLHIATVWVSHSARSVFFILGTFCVIFLQDKYTVPREQKKSCDPLFLDWTIFDHNWVFALKDAGLGQLYDNFAWERCTQDTLTLLILKETLAFLPVTGSHLSGIQSFLASPQQCLGCLVLAPALQTLV